MRAGVAAAERRVGGRSVSKMLALCFACAVLCFSPSVKGISEMDWGEKGVKESFIWGGGVAGASTFSFAVRKVCACLVALGCNFGRSL